MSLISAHGFDEEALKTYKHIYYNDFFSIAIYTGDTNKKMKSFYHKHEEYEFLIPVNTIPLLRYDNAVYVGEVGYCYPVNPFTNHGIEFELNSDAYSIVVKREYLDHLKEELGFKDRYFYTRFLVSKNLLKAMSLLRTNKSTNNIRDIIKTLIYDGLSSNIDSRRPPNKYFPDLKRCIIYMTDNYTRHDLTIKEIADYSSYAYTYFTKVFCQFMAETPISYLNKLRLSKAKELMKNEDLSLQEIAKLSGFKTASKFTESFKRNTGISPKEYKKQYIK